MTIVLGRFREAQCIRARRGTIGLTAMKADGHGRLVGVRVERDSAAVIWDRRGNKAGRSGTVRACAWNKKIYNRKLSLL